MISCISSIIKTSHLHLDSTYKVPTQPSLQSCFIFSRTIATPPCREVQLELLTPPETQLDISSSPTRAHNIESLSHSRPTPPSHTSSFFTHKWSLNPQHALLNPLPALHPPRTSSTSCKLPETVAKCICIVAKCRAYTSCEEWNMSGRRAEEASSEI